MIPEYEALVSNVLFQILLFSWISFSQQSFHCRDLFASDRTREV